MTVSITALSPAVSYNALQTDPPMEDRPVYAVRPAPSASTRPEPARSRPRSRTLAPMAALAGLSLMVSACGHSSERGLAAAPRPTAPGNVTSAPVPSWGAFRRWLEQRAAAGQFAGAVLVAKDGTPLLDAGYGLADRKAGIPDTARTKFCIASIGKLFTAVAIAQLVERDRLSFRDTIGKYVPGLARTIGDRVTVGELLDMTSGLGDVALARPTPRARWRG